MIYRTIRTILFKFDPETVHNMVFRVLPLIRWSFPMLRQFYSFEDVSNKFTIKDLKFRNRLGVAAGLDKNGEVIEFWDAVGFSHVGCCIVTGKQIGRAHV